MAVKKTFNFKLNDKVKLASGEAGEVIGRAQYVDSNPQYQVRYVAADGRMVQDWWNESALAAA